VAPQRARRCPAHGRRPGSVVGSHFISKRFVNLWNAVFAGARWQLVAGCVAAIVVGSGFAYVSSRFPRPEVIARHVFLEGEEVGGLTRAQARQVLQSQVDRTLNSRVRLRVRDLQWTFTRRQLGARAQIEEAVKLAYQVGRSGSLLDRARVVLFSPDKKWDIPVRYAFDRSVMTAALKKLARQVLLPARDATAELKDGVVQVNAGECGESLDVEDSCGKLIEALATPRPVTEVELVLNSLKPKVTYEDLKHLDCVLADYETPFNPAKKDRTYNLRLAAACVDKVLLKPGEVFSYNKIVGPRVKEKGYREAPIFSAGGVIKDVGGGVCQVATTVYNVALLAGLKIIQRRPHSQPVTYCPLGRDATVYFGHLDLRFRNDTSLPVYFRASVSRSHVRVTLLGNHTQKRTVELVLFDRETTPFKEVEKLDPTLPPGARVEEQEGREGVRLSLRRIIRKGDRLLANELLSRDYYKPKDRIVRVGPEPSGSAPQHPSVLTPSTAQAAPARPPTSPRPRIQDLPAD